MTQHSEDALMELLDFPLAESDRLVITDAVNELIALRTAQAEQEKRIAELEEARIRQAFYIKQTLGKALNYPLYDNTDTVCVGEHTPESLVDEAARRIAEGESFKGEAAKANWLKEQAETQLAEVQVQLSKTNTALTAERKWAEDAEARYDRILKAGLLDTIDMQAAEAKLSQADSEVEKAREAALDTATKLSQAELIVKTFQQFVDDGYIVAEGELAAALDKWKETKANG